MVGNNYGTYVFDPSARTITLSGLPSVFAQNQLKLIIDSATNAILFNLLDLTKTATVVGNVITLTTDTNSLSSSDNLQIFLEVPELAISISPGTVVSGAMEITDGSNILGTTAHPLVVDGSNVVQPISGTVSLSGSPTVSVSNFPSAQTVSSSQLPTSLDGSGNFKVAVENSVSVTGTFWPGTQPVSGTVSTHLQDGSGNPISSTSGALNVSVVGGSSANPSASNTGSPVPTKTDYVGFNDSGNLVGVSSSHPLPVVAVPGTGVFDVNPQAQLSNSYYPAPYNYRPAGVVSSLNLDSDGHLITRGLVMSDEGSFRDCFIGTSLNSVLTGTLTFQNGSTTVTGVGTAFTTEILGLEYDAVKLSTAPEIDFSVVSTVESDTSLTLASAYTGTSGNGVGNQTRWLKTISAGSSISVSTSDVHITNGVVNDALTGIQSTYSDYGPLVAEFYGSIDNSITNRTVVFGLQDVMGDPTSQVTVQFDGVTNSGLFVTSVSGSPDDTDSTYFSLPGTSTYFDEHKYRISFSNNRATLSVDGIAVASNTLHIPAPYTDLYTVAYIKNNGVPSGNTTLTLDFIYLADVNRIEIDSAFDESLHTSISGPNDTNNVAVTVTPYNALRVTPSSTQILFEPFSTDINAEIWNVSSGNGGSDPISGGFDSGNVIYNPGTVVNGFSLLQTKDSFQQTAPGFLLNIWVVALDPTATVDNYRFWGLGTTLTEPNLTTPLIDGYGFEIGIDGKLYAVCYQGIAGTTTTRVLINDLTNVQPLDGMPHSYYTYSVATEIYWCIDSKENVVASYKDVLSAPHYFKLPLTALSISDGATQTLVTAGLVLGEDSHLGSQLVDGTYAWRKATIKKASTAPVSTDTSLVVSLHPVGSLPAGTNVIGSVNINTGQSVAVTQGTSPWVTSGTVFSKLQDGSGSSITSTSNALDVNIKSGGGTTQYTTGVTQSTPVGTVALGQNPSNVLKPLQVDSNGYLEVNVVGGVTISGGSFTPASDAATGTAVPLDASFLGYRDGSGNLIGVGTTTPLPITGSITAVNPSVGVVGSAVVLSSTQIGFSQGGNLVTPSTANPLPVAVVSGSVNANVTNIVPVSQSGTWSTRLVGNAGAIVDAVVGGTQPANLIQVGGQATLANPVYTTAQQNPISLTTSGGVRTDITSVAGVAVTAVPSSFGANPTGSVQGVNASIFAGSTSIPSGTFGTSPTAVGGTIPVNASLYVGTAQITTTGTAGQPLVGAITYVSGSPVDPRQIRALTSSDQITLANSSLAVTGTFWQVTQPVSGTVASTLQDGSGNLITSTTGSLNVNITGGGVVQYADGAISATPTGTVSFGQASGGSVQAIQTDSVGNQLTVLTSTGGTQTGVFAGGRLNVASEPSQLFVDAFDTFDTVNNWQTPISSGGGVTAAVSLGSLVLGTGITTGGYSYLQSVPNFPPAIPSYLTAQFVIKLEYPVTTQTYRFWGFGTTVTNPTIATPLINAVGFELYTDGKLYAVVYSGGTRTVIQDLSSTGNSKQPTDGNFHRYSLAWRSDKQFFMIDSSDPVATGNYTMPQIQTLPLKLQAIAGTSPLASGNMTVASVGIGDSGANNITISDSVYGWRGATVDTTGSLLVQMTDMVNLMSRLLKVLESNATVDASNRQRIAVETMPTVTVNATLQGGANLIGSVGTAQTINTAAGNPYTVGAANIQSVQEGPVDQRWRIIHEARNAYANGIRSKITFS